MRHHRIALIITTCALLGACGTATDNGAGTDTGGGVATPPVASSVAAPVDSPTVTNSPAVPTGSSTPTSTAAAGGVSKHKPRSTTHHTTHHAAPKVPDMPAGATALCKDGTYSRAKHHQGACSHHGGVAKFYR